MATTNKIELGKWYFEDGLPGFPQLQFFQLQQEESGSAVFLLQSLEDQQVGFWVVDPFTFFPDYSFDLPHYVADKLRISEDGELAVVNIMTLHEKGQVTVNLKAPIVVNTKKRMAQQIILSEDKYDVRQPLFQLHEKEKVVSEQVDRC